MHRSLLTAGLGTVLTLALGSLTGPAAQASPVVGIAAVPAAAAAAAPGDRLLTVNFSQTCTSGVGVGLAFDGQNLWYSCYNSPTDLYRANATLGTVTAAYGLLGGIGALAYDAPGNALWATRDAGGVYKIQLDAGKNVVSSTQAFATPAGLIDGLAYDAQDTSLYYSPDGSTTITHFSKSGTNLGVSNWAGLGSGSCGNSGLAVGGTTLLQGADGCNRIYTSTKANPAIATTSFGTAVPGDSNPRDEGLTCDPLTFGTQVIWSKEAYSPDRANAYAVAPGTCGLGGTSLTGGSNTTAIQESNPAINYGKTWNTANCTCFNGGHTKFSLNGGATATYHFTGQRIQWVSEQSPSRGYADVSIDGAVVQRVNNYTSTNNNSTVVFDQSFASSGTHTITITVVYTPGHTRADVDAFLVTAPVQYVTRQETDPNITYLKAWTVANCVCFNGGHTKYALQGGAQATFQFAGTRVQWLSEQSPSRGLADVYLDGTKVARVDNYSLSNQNAVPVYESPSLAVGSHTLRIVVVGTPGHTRADIDAFNVAS